MSINQEPISTRTEDIWSASIAALGFLLSGVGIVSLLLQAGQHSWHLIGFSVYGFGLLSMFATSALHHGVDGSERLTHLFHQLDYYAISIMIAGTFTPFCLIMMRDPLGWTIFGLIWGLAFLGILLKATMPHAPKWLTTGIFLGMGWLGVAIAYRLFQLIGWPGLSCLMIGGLFYTAGAMIFFFEKPNPFPGRFGFHELWHLFVLGGAASHFYLMYFYLLP